MANLFCLSSGQSAFVVVARISLVDDSILSWGKWAGKIVAVGSRAPYVAHAKVAELFHAGQQRGFSMTPISGFELSLGWMGGVRLYQDIVAASHLKQQHDKLLASMILYSMNNHVELHHVGWHYSSRDAALAAVSGTTNKLVGHEVNSDGESWYHLIEDDSHPKGYYYLEHQCGQGGIDLATFHWDVVVNNPRIFLEFIAGAYDQEPQFFGKPRESDPVGAVWVVGDDLSILGVTARANWWEVK